MQYTHFLVTPTAFQIHTTDPNPVRGYPTLPSERETVVQPDYTKETIDVYREVAVEFLKQPEIGIHVLEYIAHNKASVQGAFPSWIPLWNISNIPRTFLPGRAELSYAASGTLLPSPIEFANRDTLRLKGLQVDSAIFVWPFPGSDAFNILNNVYVYRTNETPDRDLNPVEYLLRTFPEALTPHSDNANATNLKDFSVTLTAGFTHYTQPLKILAWANSENLVDLHFADFCAYRLQKAEIWGPTISDREELLKVKGGDAERYLENVQRACADRAFFRTAKGSIGLGPRIMEVGDECWLPIGARVPYIVRRMDGGYKILGQAYIHRFMNGEWAEGLSENDTEEMLVL